VLVSAGTSPILLSRQELSMDRASAGGMGLDIGTGVGGHKSSGIDSLVSGTAAAGRIFG